MFTIPTRTWPQARYAFITEHDRDLHLTALTVRCGVTLVVRNGLNLAGSLDVGGATVIVDKGFHVAAVATVVETETSVIRVAR